MNLPELLFLYAVGQMVSLHFLHAWLTSSISAVILGPYIKSRTSIDVYTQADVAIQAPMLFGKAAALLTCPPCSGTWIALGVALIICLLTGLPLVFALAGLGWCYPNSRLVSGH